MQTIIFFFCGILNSFSPTDAAFMTINVKNCSLGSADNTTIVGFCVNSKDLTTKCRDLQFDESEADCPEFHGFWCCYKESSDLLDKIDDTGLSADQLVPRLSQNLTKLVSGTSRRRRKHSTKPVSTVTTRRTTTDRKRLPAAVFERNCQVGDIITQANGKERRNWYPHSGINKTLPLNVKWNVTLNDGEQFYAMPLVYCGVVLLTGMQNNVYVVNAKTGELIASRNLGLPYDIQVDTPACKDASPFVGILSTPVIDPTTDTVFMTYSTYLNGTNSTLNNNRYMMHALDVFTLQPRPNFPLTFEASRNGKTFKAGFQMQRPGLLMVEGKLYVGFASHCDLFQFHGWVFKIDALTGTIDDFFITTGDRDDAVGAGMWQAGTGLSSDRSGRLFAATGNAAMPDEMYANPMIGTQPPEVTSEAILRLNTSSMKVDDFFSPYNVALLDQLDLDLGTSGVVLLPSEFGTSEHPNLGLATGKEGIMYVVDIENLGGYQQGPNNTDKVIFKAGNFGMQQKAALFCSPSVWPVDKMVYLSPTGGPISGLQKAINDTTRLPLLELVGRTKEEFKFLFGTPTVVFSQGEEPGTASVWVADRKNGLTLVFDSTPDEDGNLPLIARLKSGPPTKFAHPVAAHGLVYLATFEGRLVAMGN